MEWVGWVSWKTQCINASLQIYVEYFSWHTTQKSASDAACQYSELQCQHIKCLGCSHRLRSCDISALSVGFCLISFWFVFGLLFCEDVQLLARQSFSVANVLYELLEVLNPWNLNWLKQPENQNLVVFFILHLSKGIWYILASSDSTK